MCIAYYVAKKEEKEPRATYCSNVCMSSLIIIIHMYKRELERERE